MTTRSIHDQTIHALLTSTPQPLNISDLPRVTGVARISSDGISLLNVVSAEKTDGAGIRGRVTRAIRNYSNIPLEVQWTPLESWDAVAVADILNADHPGRDTRQGKSSNVFGARRNS